MVRDVLEDMLREAFEAARGKGELSAPELPSLLIEIPPNEDFGDYSTNLALLLAKTERKAPMMIAERLKENLPPSAGVLAEVRIEKPGFLNFFMEPAFLSAQLSEALRAPERFGRSDMGAGQSVHLEFVSANPTGPLHVGHGRGAALGDSLGRLLEFCGYRVHREYYVNDAGNQMEMLGESIRARYYISKGKNLRFPEGGYQGKYIEEIAGLPITADAISRGGDDEKQETREVTDSTMKEMLRRIKKSLDDFRVPFDEWFRESALFEGGEGAEGGEWGQVGEALAALEASSNLYEENGAKWLKSADYGDEKNRVVVREDGRPTYLASDIAYHRQKYGRGFDRCINIWGADHHGYLPRVRASIEMLGLDPDRLRVLFVQFVSLRRGGEPVQMSTRSGEFEELATVVEEVGVDAARFFFLLRSPDTTLEFDLDLAKEESSENPVYYVQYAHARTCSLFRQAAAQGVSVDDLDAPPEGGLTLPEEHKLARAVLEWPHTVRMAAETLEPHRISFALIALAKQFHGYYNRQRILEQEPTVTRARLCLARCVQAVIANGLELLGVSAPEKM